MTETVPPKSSKLRVFYSRRAKTAVRHWIWAKGFGVIVVYKDGNVTKSNYTLPELVASGEAREGEA